MSKANFKDADQTAAFERHPYKTVNTYHYHLNSLSLRFKSKLSLLSFQRTIMKTSGCLTFRLRSHP